MRTYLIPVGMALLFAVPASAWAAPSTPDVSRQTAAATDRLPLTLPEALRRAFQTNPSLRAAQREIGIAAGQRRQAASFPNPELGFSSEGLDRGRRTRTIQLSQPIELGGKRAARIAAADIEEQIASAELARARDALRADVVSAFFNLVSAQERLRLAQDSAQLARRVTDATSRRVIAGRISPVEETRSRVAESSNKIELAQAERELMLAQRQLAATWGANAYVDGSAMPPDHLFSALPGAGELVRRLAASPQLEQARLEVERQKALTLIERRKAVPDLTVTVGKQREEQFGQPDIRQTVVGLSIPLPLFDRNRGNVLSGLRRTDKAQDELRATETRLTVELTETLARFDNARTELALLGDEIIPGATSAYEAALRGFELGKFNFVDVLDAQRTLVQAKTQYVRALSESHRALAEIERFVGPVLPDAASGPMPKNDVESK